MFEGRGALLLFYLLFIMIVFQVQNVRLLLAIGLFELPNAVERISKGTKAVASGPPPSDLILVTTIGLYITV